MLGPRESEAVPVTLVAPRHRGDDSSSSSTTPCHVMMSPGRASVAILSGHDSEVTNHSETATWTEPSSMPVRRAPFPFIGPPRAPHKLNGRLRPSA